MTLDLGFMVSNGDMANHVRLRAWAQAMGWTANEIGDGLIRWDLPYNQSPIVMSENDHARLHAALSEYARRFPGDPYKGFAYP